MSIMRNRKRKKDSFPRLIMAAFFLLSAMHFNCRFDMSGQLENLFARAWAEPTSQQAAEPGQPAAGSIADNTADPTVIVAGINRNPFMAPSDIITPPAKPAPAPAAGRQGAPVPAGASGGSSYQAAPAAAPEPHLRGVVKNGTQMMAIIEYAGRSGSYRIGQDVGDGYYVTSIGTNYAEVDQDGDTTHLTLGR